MHLSGDKVASVDLGHNMARFRRRDIEDLTAVSVKLAEVAGAIQQVRSPWSGAAVQLLRESNEIVLSVRDRALAKMQRYLVKHGVKIAPPAPDAGGAGDEPSQGGNAPAGQA